MKSKKSVFISVLIFFLLGNSIVGPVLGVEFRKNIFENNIIRESIDELPGDGVAPGDIIDISFSNLNPTLGEPVKISITLKGNPIGERFDEILLISDDYEGLIAKSNGIEWKAGNVTLDPVSVKIGRFPFYIKKIRWYPVVVGNHTLQIKAGSFPAKTKNVSVGFDVENIISPSIGQPSIITKSEELLVVVSEERHISESSLTIQHAELEDGDGSYILDNQTMRFCTWIHAGEGVVEDELIVSFNISSIPCGFYNLSITTLKDMYIWPHAVKIIESEPTEYMFVQLSDIHIGKNYNTINEKNELEDVIHYINKEIKPDFVVMTGDLVDWCKVKGNRNFFIELQDAILTCNSPVFTTPGNHDRYETGLFRLYRPFRNLLYYHEYLSPICDYGLEYGDINFLFLDSGHEYSRWEIKRKFWHPTPEASGLTNNQMYLLENELGNNQMHQIIFMHHPAVTEVDDSGLFAIPDNHPSGNEGCIAFNRIELINYSVDNNVSLVLVGHTHRNVIFNSSGENPSDIYEWPLFVQMGSSTLNGTGNGGRVVEIKDGKVESYKYVPLIYDKTLPPSFKR
ncbi:MAG: metallophosphoesterase [Thermoplasmatales archaeon]|nr:MAG: metallophosphoesterase [Thermoplasmatales archaeon]